MYGVMVREVDGWHEAKVGVVAGWDGQHSQQPSYVAAREGKMVYYTLEDEHVRGLLRMALGHRSEAGACRESL